MPEGERASEKDTSDALSASSSTHNLPSITQALAPTGPAVTDAERATWEAEKQKLYQQLDEKVGRLTEEQLEKFMEMPQLLVKSREM